MPSGPRVEMRLLGRFIVLRDGAEIPAAAFGGRKVRTLLRILATRRGEFQSHDVLTDLLWLDRPPAEPAANLQVLVNRIRRATGEPALVQTGTRGYALSADPGYAVDAERFSAALKACGLLRGSDALAAYRIALADFTGEPLAEDRYADWAEPYRVQLFRTRQDALEQAAALAMEQGQAALAVEYAAVAAADEPLREVAALTLVRALDAAGDRAAALEQYDRYRRALAEELGLDPSPVALAVQAALLRGPQEGAVAGDRPLKFTREPSTFGTLNFVGRQRERDTVLAALGSSGVGVVTIAGRPGTGKSRLLREITAATGGASIRAYWPERSEAWSLARGLLREVMAADVAGADGLPASLRSAVGSIVPELEGASAAIADAESRRALILESAVRLVTDMGDTPVVVDDVQWADPSSVLLLATLLDRVPGLSMVLAYRSEEIDPAGEVAAFLNRIPVAAEIRLTALDGSAIRELSADPVLTAALTGATDGTPFALAEVLRALARDGEAVPDKQGRWRLRSPGAAARAIELGALGQRRAIARRAARHVGAEREILGLLALLGRQTPARTLAAASGLAESAALGAVTVLSAAGLVRLGDRGWTTSHDLVSEVVSDRLDPDEGGRLHGLIARALEDEEGNPAERARHWRGAGDASRAAAAFGDAAQRALDSFADHEAEELADAGLSHPTSPQVRARLLEVRAQVRRRRGDIAGARTDLRAALAAYRSGPSRAGVLAQLAMLASGADDILRASELAELAIVEAGDQPAARAQALEVASVLDMNLGRRERAATRAQEALLAYQREGDSGGAARVLDARAMAAFFEGDVREGTRLLNQVANLFEDSGDLLRMVTPRSTRGHGLVFLDQAAEGLRDASAALDLARSLGHPEGQAYALWHRSEALSALGECEDALADGREALSLAEWLGHRGWTATAWRAIGIAEQSAGDHDAALNAFRTSLALSENLELFHAWAAARAALASVALGRLDEAESLVAEALATGPALGHYEGRLAQVELALARGDEGVSALADAALRQAEAGGLLAHRARLIAVRASRGGRGA